MESITERILVFRAPFKRSGAGMGVETPLELMCLAQALDKAGLEAAILDGPIHEDPLEALDREVRRLRPALVGVSAYTVNIELALEAVRRVKSVSPRSLTALGGIHASALPEETLRAEPALDFVVAGEGEQTVVELAECALRGSWSTRVRGLFFRNSAGGIDHGPARPVIRPLDRLPFLDLSRIDLRRYAPYVGNYKTLPSVNMMSVRGCPFNCSYCSTHELWGNTVRFLSAERLLAEVERFHEKFGIRDLRFNDDTFPARRDRVVEFCEGVLRKGWRLNWNCYSRVDTLDPELVRLMKRAGCYHIKFGVEVGTRESLDRINKRADLEQAEAAVRMTRRAGIVSKASFLLGVEGEDLERVRATVRFAARLNPEFAIFNVLAYLPGSPDYHSLLQSGVVDRDRSWPAVRKLNAENAERWSREKRRAYLVFYLSPRYWLTNGPRLLFHFFNSPAKLVRAARVFVEKLLQARYS